MPCDVRAVAAALHPELFTTASSNSNSGSSSASSAVTLQASLSSCDDATGNGEPMLDSKAYTRFVATMGTLQVAASAIERVQTAPIGTGGFAKVYKVKLQSKSTVYAAKVCMCVDCGH
jgi:hypothetical protein